MKLLNHTLAYFAAILFLVITGWATLFYYNLLDEIYDSLDDGLGNYKLLIIKKLQTDSSILGKSSFGEDNYTIKPVAPSQALAYTDVYRDTTMFMENEQDFEPVRMLTSVFKHNGTYYELRVINTMIETDDLMEELLHSLLWLYLGLIVSIMVLNNLLLRKTWRPFYQLVHQLKNFRLENQVPVRFGKTNVEEFNILNDAVAKLIEDNTRAYQSQKQFIENASHELQTPLAISLNKLELLTEQNSLTDEQLQLIAGAISHLERMTRLNKSLLLLSKIENKQFRAEKAVSLNSLLKTLILDFADLASYKEVTITLHEAGECLLRIDPDLANVLLTNLIKNAIVHNLEGGAVHITLSPQKLVVENTGKEQPLDERRMFSRFQNGGESESSTGLGLPIVKAISDLYHFRVAYHYHEMHAITIYFT